MQVIGNSNKDAERSAFAQKIKEVWPARCQPDNEQYIRSLKAKLEAALQKCARSFSALAVHSLHLQHYDVWEFCL